MGDSPFKIQIRKDANTIFLSPDEFADRHSIDGRTMSALIDTNEQIERDKKVIYEGDAIYQSRLLVYLRADEYGALPAEGKVMNIDGRPYLITRSVDEDGIYSIEVEAMKS